MIPTTLTHSCLKLDTQTKPHRHQSVISDGPASDLALYLCEKGFES